MEAFGGEGLVMDLFDRTSRWVWETSRLWQLIVMRLARINYRQIRGVKINSIYCQGENIEEERGVYCILASCPFS